MDAAQDFFTGAEKQKIAEATRLAQAGAGGEIAVLVAESSDHYADVEAIGGFLLSGVISFFIARTQPGASLPLFAALAVVLFFPARWGFARFPLLKRPLLAARRRDEAVEAAAMRAFHEQELHQSEHRRGVLFFISVLEKTVWVLADEGIYPRISHERLKDMAQAVSRGIREGRACDALCDAIGEVGRLRNA
jgi:putative membrane protein